MDTLAVVHANTDSDVRERAELVRRSISTAAGKGYLPGPTEMLARVA